MSIWNLPLAIDLPEIRTPAPGPVRSGRYGLTVTAVPGFVRRASNDLSGCELVLHCSCCGASSSDDLRGASGWRVCMRGDGVRAEFCPSCPKGNVYRR